MAMEAEVIEHFFGVYLLYCKNPKYKGRTYIGYTVDPKRRIKQHNAGQKFGGAWRTSNRGPWEMVLIVHGFPNSTAALRFEWAWQHPELSRRLKHVPKKKSRQSAFEYRLTVLSEMLQVGPWSRLPLTMRWLEDTFGAEYSKNVSPPLHMPITFGKVTSKKPKESTKERRKKTTGVDEEEENEQKLSPCTLCKLIVDNEDRITCLKPSCSLVSHLVCLAESFVKDGQSVCSLVTEKRVLI
ncbi:structure-specific endonuclease subunit slx1 isoform X2 [Phymastichus coffea]|uniref:structure-specific endonuclease subunit slx1 isoform X2 n=1 Tax=Phymastichus coffea TaxID=108790 RepID=UPI00273AECD2|nr:structure-specific endonuclease subunit slx1 isoform X2 [Phymastichus coffea]